MKSRKKFYAVVSKGSKYLHGAFLFSPEGKIQAEKYVQKLNKEKKDKFEIIEK